MDRFTRIIARLIVAGRRAYESKWSFTVLFVGIFLFSVLILGFMDLLPEKDALQPGAQSSSTATDTLSEAKVELPERIEIAAISLSAPIGNPEHSDIQVLDTALLKGAVRYPTSAKLGETGNIVLFGHSSYLPVVGNQAYKTFNGIQKLKAGDRITLFSSDAEYVYSVKSVTKESAADSESGIIPLDITGRELTLATCDSFGKKTDRFVVTADFVESHSLSS